MIDPEKRSKILRKNLIKNGKFLIAKIGGTGQDPKERKVLDIYFRYKDYLDPIENSDWFSVSIEEIWSPKFIGLRKNFWNLPIEKIKILEFQNPPYSAAFRMGGDSRKYAKVFTFQIAGCNFDCIYCYVPPELKIASQDFGKYFSAKEIVNKFLEIKKERKNEEWNVLRISGGEPLGLVPELVLEIEKEIAKRCPQTYLWVETNLSTPKYVEKFKRDLAEVFKKKNVGVVGCFKGVGAKDFSILTGVEKKFYENQFKVTQLLMDLKADLYLYLPALVYGNDLEEKMVKFLKKLQEIHPNLPLRLELLIMIKDYPAAKLNILQKEKEGRLLPKVDQKVIFDLWYNKILPRFYSKEKLEKYCCQIKIY